MTTLTENPRVYDVLKWEVDSRFCRVSATIKNVSGVAIEAGAIQPGMILNLNGAQYETGLQADDGAFEAIYVDPRTSPALDDDEITAEKYSLLVRGPALVNPDAFPVNDLAGDPYTLTDIITRLAALDIQVLREATKQTTQDT